MGVSEGLVYCSRRSERQVLLPWESVKATPAPFRPPRLAILKDIESDPLNKLIRSKSLPPKLDSGWAPGASAEGVEPSVELRVTSTC